LRFLAAFDFLFDGRLQLVQFCRGHAFQIHFILLGITV
jgi:hypothetical protein